MGIYDKKPIKILPSSGGKKIPVVNIAIGALVLLLVAFAILSAFTVEPVIYSFDKNAISTNEQALLKVGVSNPFPQTAKGVKVKVYAEDPKSISVGEPVRTIEILDSYRELSFIVNPVGNVLPGSYLINISVEINGQEYTKSTSITIQ